MISFTRTPLEQPLYRLKITDYLPFLIIVFSFLHLFIIIFVIVTLAKEHLYPNLTSSILSTTTLHTLKLKTKQKKHEN